MAADGVQPIRRCDKPPPRSGPEIRVERLAGGETRDVVILSRALFGVWIHYDERTRRSEECFQDPDKCPGCQQHKPSKWRGYLHVAPGGLAAPYIIELTPECARLLLERFTGSLRGIRVQFRRTAKNNGRLLLEVPEWGQPKTDNFPAEIDPEPILRWLWNWRKGR